MLIVTADSLRKIVPCNGSLKLPVHKEFEPDHTVRDEGNAAHWLIEQVFKRLFGTDELIERQAPNGIYITEEMVEHVTPYLELIRGWGNVEVVTSYSDGQTYQVNGRADCIGLEGTTLHVPDFKYGWGIIEPDRNWTLLSHAFGWLFVNPELAKTVTHVKLTIVQPRGYHPLSTIRSATYPIEQMWTEFWPILEATLKHPTDALNTGDQCKKCDRRAGCPAAVKASMNSIDVSELAYVDDMDDGSLAFLLDQFERATKTLEGHYKSLTELALHRIKAGRVIPGRTVERELTNKQWKKGITVDTAMMLTGKNLAKPVLITPNQAVKAGVAQEAIDALTERVEKGWKLSKVDAKTAVLKNFGEILK